jgi:hypothetical protein
MIFPIGSGSICCVMDVWIDVATWLRVGSSMGWREGTNMAINAETLMRMGRKNMRRF